MNKKVPNSKFQAPKKPNPERLLRNRCLMFGVSLELGVWDLELSFPP